MENQEEKEEEMISDKALVKLIDYLRARGWTEKEINDLLYYIAKE
jgi:hypothetical protein